MRRKPGAEVGFYGLFGDGAPIDWTGQDIAWLLDELSVEHSEKHRATALRFPIQRMTLQS